MPSASIENIDVFLPGQGDVLAQAPAYKWEYVQNIVGHFYTSTQDPNKMLVNVKGATAEQRKQLANIQITVDPTGLRFHDYDGFGIHTPGLIVTQKGTAIAICQQRPSSMSDTGHAINILISRSEDGGKTWQPQRVVFSEEDITTMLGPIFQDAVTNTVYIAFWKMPASVLDDLGYFDTYARQDAGFWLLKSEDEGKSWSQPYHVRTQPNDDGWIGWSNNCVHGIQLSCKTHSDRLVIPAFVYKEGETGQVPGLRGGLLYSDDHGESWTTGAVLPEGSDEVTLAETVDGGIYVSYRKNTCSTGKRHFARSTDGGGSFCEHGQHEDITDRNLHAGLVRYSSEADGKPNILLFSNPPGMDMTVYMSRDEGRTWPIRKVLAPGPSRYSDLAVTDDDTILCLYTNGKARDTEKITVARFDLEWLMDAGE